MSGFPDGTFKPDGKLTREQGIALLSKILGRVPADFHYEVATDLADDLQFVFHDLKVNRWSFPAIMTASEKGLVAGYPDGSFQPERELTRAEFMAMLRRSATYVRATLGLSQKLPDTAAAIAFSDMSKHWASGLVSEMQTLCNVASPVGEKGTKFAPNESISRGYAAAAANRFLTCVAEGTKTSPKGAFDSDTLEKKAEFVVVTLSGLNCREKPNTSAAPVFSLLNGGQFLHAMKGSDDKNLTSTDSTGRVWLQVRPHGYFADAQCWVSANRENLAAL